MELLDPKPGQLDSAAFHGPWAALGSGEGMVDVYELPAGRHRLRARPFENDVKGLAFSGDGLLIAAASARGDLALIPREGGEAIPIEGGMGAAHACVALSHDGRAGVASFTTFFHGHEGTRFVRIEDGRCARSVFVRKLDCTGLWPDPSGAGFLGLIDGAICSLDADFERRPLGPRGVRVLAFEPVSGLAVVAGDGETTSILNARSGDLVPLHAASPGRDYTIAPARGELVWVDAFLGSDLLRVHRWSIKDGARIAVTELDGFLQAFVDPERLLVITGNVKGALLTFDLAAGRAGPHLRRTSSIERRAAAMDDRGAPLLVTFEEDAGLFVHRPGERPTPLPASAGVRLDGIQVSSDGRRAVGVGWDGLGRVWDLESGDYLGASEVFNEDERRGEDMPQVLIAPDGSALVPLCGEPRLTRLSPAPRATGKLFFSIREALDLNPDEDDELREIQQFIGTPSLDAGRTELLPGGKGLVIYNEKGSATIVPDPEGGAKPRRSPAKSKTKSNIKIGPAGEIQIQKLLPGAKTIGIDRRGSRLAVAAGRRLNIYDIETGEKTQLGPLGARFIMLRFSPSGDLIAVSTGSTSKKGDDTRFGYFPDDDGLIPIQSLFVEVWSIPEARPLWRVELTENEHLVGVSDDGERLVMGRDDRLLVYERDGSSGRRRLEYLALPHGEMIEIEGGAARATSRASTWSGLVHNGRISSVEETGGAVLPPLKIEPASPKAIQQEVERARAEARQPRLAPLLGPKASLDGLDLRGASLARADLTGASLRGADLRAASLKDARLDGADLRGARLQSSDLGGARLDGAALEGARLEAAVLRATEVTPGELAQTPSGLRFFPDAEPPFNLALNASGTQLATLINTGDDEQEVHTFDVASGLLLGSARVIKASALLFGPDDLLWVAGRDLALFRDGRLVASRKRALASPLERFYLGNRPVPLALSLDGSLLVHAAPEPRLDFYDRATLKRVHAEPLADAKKKGSKGDDDDDDNYDNVARLVAFGPGRLAVYRGATGFLSRGGIDILALPEGGRLFGLRRLKPPSKRAAMAAGAARSKAARRPLNVRAITFRPDGALVAIDDDGQAWESDVYGQAFKKRGRCTDINNLDSLAITSDGERMFACESRPEIWDIASARKRLRCELSPGNVHISRAVIAASGLVAAAIDHRGGHVLVWDLRRADDWPYGAPRAFSHRAFFALPGGNFLTAGAAGFLRSEGAEPKISAWWPSGRLSALSSPEVGRWRLSAFSAGGAAP